MNTRITCFITIFLVLFSFSCLSQQIESFRTIAIQEQGSDVSKVNVFSEKTRYGVGLHGSFLSGYGLSVRYHPVGRLGLQVTGFMWKTKDKFTYSLGTEGQFDLDVEDYARFYAFAGMGVYGDAYKSPFRAGIGIAYEWVLSGKLVLSPNIAITYFSENLIYPIPAIALYYYFN